MKYLLTLMARLPQRKYLNGQTVLFEGRTYRVFHSQTMLPQMRELCRFWYVLTQDGEFVLAREDRLSLPPDQQLDLTS